MMNLLLSSVSKTAFAVAGAMLIWGAIVSPSQADTTTTLQASPRVLQEALATHNNVSLYEGKTRSGFNLSSGFFSGYASGIDSLAPINALSFNKASDMAGDQRVYALLIDGRYDFNHDAGAGMPFHPFLLGGLGMATYGSVMNSSLTQQGGDMVPLFRIGGGVTYRLGEKWDLSLDYKAGLSGASGDQIFTGRGQQPVNLQALNMGMSYQF